LSNCSEPAGKATNKEIQNKNRKKKRKMTEAATNEIYVLNQEKEKRENEKRSSRKKKGWKEEF